EAGDDLLIADALAARLMDLIEADPGRRLGRREQVDRDRDQGQPDTAGPIGAGWHLAVLAGIAPSGRKRRTMRRVPPLPRLGPAAYMGLWVTHLPSGPIPGLRRHLRL